MSIKIDELHRTMTITLAPDSEIVIFSRNTYADVLADAKARALTTDVCNSIIGEIQEVLRTNPEDPMLLNTKRALVDFMAQSRA